MNVKVKPADISQKSLIRSFIQDYLTELSQFPDENPDYQDEQGIFHYPYLDDYWRNPERFPFIISYDEKQVGFAFVRKVDDHWEMAEYYVLPGFRRRRLGFSCAAKIIKNHPGLWKIGFNKQNYPSRQLWKKLAHILGHDDIEEGQLDDSHDYIFFSV